MMIGLQNAILTSLLLIPNDAKELIRYRPLSVVGLGIVLLAALSEQTMGPLTN